MLHFWAFEKSFGLYLFERVFILWPLVYLSCFVRHARVSICPFCNIITNTFSKKAKTYTTTDSYLIKYIDAFRVQNSFPDDVATFHLTGYDLIWSALQYAFFVTGWLILLTQCRDYHGTQMAIEIWTSVHILKTRYITFQDYIFYFCSITSV